MQPTTTPSPAYLRERASILRRDVETLRELETNAANEEREAFRLGLPGQAHAANLRERAYRAQLEASEREARELDAQADTLEREQAERESEAKTRAERVRIVRRVEVESFGVDGAQYFRGAGVEDFEEVALGVGNSEREAVEDALETLAQSGAWTWKSEDGYPSEPSLEDYSETDEVSPAEAEGRRDALGSEPEPRYRVALFPFNGCGPIVLREGLDSREQGLEAVASILESKRAQGFETSEVEPFKRWECQREDSGVSDSEGILALEVENARELEQYAERAERLDEEPSELHYYACVRVSDVPESDGEQYGLPIVELDGSEYLFAATDEDAESAALEAARGSLWAFSLDFLRHYLPDSVSEDSSAFRALQEAQGKTCESFGPILEGLLGSRCEEALRDAIATDGRGHFLASYDGNEDEDSDGAFRYRIG